MKIATKIALKQLNYIRPKSKFPSDIFLIELSKYLMKIVLWNHGIY